MPNYMTKKQALIYLGLSPASYDVLDSYVQNGLPIIKIGKSTRFSKESIDNFMKDHEVKNQKKEG